MPHRTRSCWRRASPVGGLWLCALLVLLQAGGCVRLGYDQQPTPDRGGQADAPLQPSDGGGPILPGGAEIFVERFDDGAFASRGWYDDSEGTITTEQHAPGSTSAFECVFGDDGPNAGPCVGGAPRRRLFEATPSIHISYWVKYAADFTGATELFVLTDVDRPYVGPFLSSLTVTVNTDAAGPYLRFTDNANTDPACVKLADGTVLGCDGDFDSYGFSEARSVCGCNGVVGDVDRFDCYRTSTGFSSERSWHAPPAAMKTTWQRVTILLQMNSIREGRGVPDGRIRYLRDGVLLIAYDQILMRTGAHPTMSFNQIFLNPVAGGPGQRLWIDDLVVSIGAPP